MQQNGNGSSRAGGPDKQPGSPSGTKAHSEQAYQPSDSPSVASNCSGDEARAAEHRYWAAGLAWRGGGISHIDPDELLSGWEARRDTIR